MVYVRRGAAVYVERDAEVLKRFLYHLVVAVHHLLHRDALLAGAYGDGYAVFVRTADEHYVTFLQTKVAHVDVGRHIYPGKMADVYASVGVRQGGSDRRSLVVFLFHVLCFC